MKQEIKQRIEQIKNGQVPEGYKKTEFGVFPCDWILNTIGNISKGKGKYGINAPACEKAIGLPKYLRITDIDEFGNYIDNNAYVDSVYSSEYILKNGDIVFARTGASVGKIYFYSAKDGILVYAGFLIKFSIDNNKCNPYIVKAVCSTPRYNKWVEIMSARSGQPGINAEEYASYAFFAPKNIKEQEKIAEILMKWDKMIELKKQEIEALKKLKKAYLSKMFPKKGSVYPEIRFSGFTEPWEQRKVSDLLQERNEQAPMSEEYPLMAFIANQGVAPKGERYDRSALVNDEAGKKYKRTEYGDFIYSSNNLETGSIGLNKYGNSCISPVYSIFKPTGKADLDFLGRRFLRKDFINEMVKWRQGVVYGQWKIHESDFLKIEIAIPSIDEQKAIGKYLDNLDNIITLHQRDLEKTEKQRKSLVQLLLTGIVRVF